MNLLSCKDIFREISNYLDEELDEELRRTIQQHLGACKHCSAVVDTTRKTIELYCDGKLFPLPEPVRARLHEAIRQRWREKGR